MRAGLALAAAIGVGGAVLVVQRAGKAEPVAMARKLPAPAKLPAALVHGGSGARFMWRKLGELERIDLEEGEINLAVRHLGPSERVIVSTGDAEVEVRGTVFHVEAHARHVARVAVSEGRVEVRYAGDQVFLDAGQAWSPPGGGDGLAQAAAAAGSERAGARSGDSAGAGERSAGARVSSAAGARAAHDGGSGPKPPVKAPQGAPKGSDAAASGAGNAGDEGAAKGFVEGMALVARGDYAAGAEKLEQYRAAHGDDARAEDAAYMAVLALQRAGRRDDAAVAARRYLAAYPNGRRRAEMQAIAR